MNALPGRFWRENDAVLVRMWGEGATLAAIAVALKVTLRSVSGRRARLKLPQRRPAYKAISADEKLTRLKVRNRAYWEANRERLNLVRRNGKAPKRVALPAVAAKRVQLEPAPVLGRAIPLLALKPHECRWPVTAEAPYLFCAELASESYCVYHAWKSLYHKEESASVRPRPNYHPNQPNFHAYQARAR